MIKTLAPPTAEGPPAPPPIPAESLALSPTTTATSAPPSAEELPAPPPTKVESLALSPAEIFSLEDLLFAAMVAAAAAMAAVTGAALMRVSPRSRTQAPPLLDQNDHRSRYGKLAAYH